MELRYLVIGAGGTGGAIAAYMKKAGKDVTLIARGEKRQAIRERASGSGRTGRSGPYLFPP